MSLKGQTRQQPTIAASVAVFLLGITTSLLMPLGYDEAYWVAIERMVRSGAQLYVSAIDNKSPLVYAAIWLIDLLPGPFVVARALALGALGLLSFRYLAGRHSRWVAALVTSSCLLLAGLQLTTEVLAAVPVVAAFHSAA